MAIEIHSAVSSPVRPRAEFRLPVLGRRNHVTTRERIVFTERLSLLLETGVALHGALSTLAGQIENPYFAGVVRQLLEDVGGGRTMSEALARHPDVFPGTYVNLIAASERGGFMDKVLRELVELDESQERLRSTVTSAMAYPVLLILFSVAVVIFVLVVVFPKFEEMFTQIRNQLPVTTLFLMALSGMLRNYWMWVLGGLGAAAWLFIAWARQPAASALLDRTKLRLPVLREVFVQIYLTKLLRVLGLSLANGVPVLDAIRECRKVIGNAEFVRFMEHLEEKVNGGEGIAVGFAETGFIPPMVQQMIATAEASGRLAQVMARIADFQMRELNKKLEMLAKLAEPLMLLVMGAVVGLLVSSLILPIFQLGRAVQ